MIEIPQCNFQYSSMIDDVDNDFSFREPDAHLDEMKNWMNRGVLNPQSNKFENRWIEWRRKLVNDSIDTNEIKEERQFTHPIVTEGTAILVKSKHSRIGNVFKWFVNTLLWKWIFKRKSIPSDKVLNNVKVKKNETMKRIRVKTVRHQNSYHIKEFTCSNDVQINIIDN